MNYNEKELDEIFDENNIPSIEELGLTPEEMKIAMSKSSEVTSLVVGAMAKELADGASMEFFAHMKTDRNEDVFSFALGETTLRGAKCRTFGYLMRLADSVYIKPCSDGSKTVHIDIVIPNIDE